MRWLLALCLAPALAAAPVAEPVAGLIAEPSDATLVYYNARLALREGHPVEAVDLWLLRNAAEAQTGRVSPFDADFRSVTWAALGSLGVCQDGFATDADGAGLWPLALHNQIVRTLGRGRPPRGPRVFDAFELGRQQRKVTITSVLDSHELATFKLTPSRCARARLMLLEAGESVTASLTDRQVAARLLRYLLVKAKATLAPDQVRGRAAIEARLFDIDLQLTALAAREARSDAQAAARRGRELGLSRPSITALTDAAPITTLNPASTAASILRASADWPASEWMALSADRRLFLYAQARAYDDRPADFDRLGLAIVDELLATGDGAGVQAWIGQLTTLGSAETRRALWEGPRGAAMLALDDEAGFRERSVIALYRGVDELERGDLEGALRSIAYARVHADESVAAEDLDGLSLRWLSYVASRFVISPELLVTLQELVPRRDYSVLLEDLLWSAALRADRRSFETGVANQLGRGALERRLGLLGPLAAGDVARFTVGIQRGLAESPSETLRFLDLLVERLALEDAGVRAAQVPTLVAVRRLLDPLASETGARGRTATSLLERTQALADGVGGLPKVDARDRARRLAPDSEVYAGSIRLAPADPLPWPFHAETPAAPSVFTPLELVPEEWHDAAGAWVYGWSIRG